MNKRTNEQINDIKTTEHANLRINQEVMYVRVTELMNAKKNQKTYSQGLSKKYVNEQTNKRTNGRKRTHE